MDNWGTEEKKKNNNDNARKILIAIMVVLVIIIGIILFLLYNIKANTFKVYINSKNKEVTDDFIKNFNENIYINIEELAKLLGYDYHIGEYKEFDSDRDKCYIKGEKETASFYLNSNKICKLKIDMMTEDYDTFVFKNPVIRENNKFYAPIDAIKVGFNTKIELTNEYLNIISLDDYVKSIENKINENLENPKYESLLEAEFDNQKALLYDYKILSKVSSGLYGVVNMQDQEILPDKYKNITFLESTKEFLVTNSLDKMGIVDEFGRNKVNQNYDSIKVINSNPKLYLVGLNEKYGVIDENGNTIVYPEYDSIGIDTTVYKKIQNKYILLDNIIPVCKDSKYGLFDTNGKKLVDIKYSALGCADTSVEINGVPKTVNPLVVIESCKGVVLQREEGKYDIYIKDSKDGIVKLAALNIYSISENGNEQYFMLYANNSSKVIQELNLIDVLVEQKIIEDPNKEQTLETNTTENNAISNNTMISNNESVNGSMVANNAQVNNITNQRN